MQFFSNFLTGIMPLIVILVILAIIAIAIKSGRSKEEFNPYMGKPLMTAHELILYKKLNELLKNTNFILGTQVCMGAIIKTKPGMDNSAYTSARNKFSKKIIDFVIADSKGKVLLIIELDDRSHNAKNDKERDKITAAAGYPTLRLLNAGKLTMPFLKDQLRPYLFKG